MALSYLISLGKMPRTESFALLKSRRTIAESYIVNYQVVQAFESEFNKYDRDIDKLYQAVHA